MSKTFRHQIGDGYGYIPEHVIGKGLVSENFDGLLLLENRAIMRVVEPERKLAAALLTQTLRDLVKFRFAGRLRYQKFFVDAWQYVMSDDERWPYSFVNLSRVLGFFPEALRKKIINRILA